ncbi:hypothetical protein [Anditalea andensis]|uniref:Lipocalin-like domain-containing protein n=1 Tax=Anditalea andensis TaxID=1048983 RepID=A0A074L4M8_9BACT|nr:hypothetical protein [Anditalea andensis]KEO75450.1 hypothetical protein EL17_00915 [Anditalea andensis]
MKNIGIRLEKWMFFIFVLIVMNLTGSCQEVDTIEEDLKCRIESVNGPDDDVIGKWKLVKEERFRMIDGEIRINDYSCNNIIYEFKEDGLLEVTNDTGDENHASGEYSYEFTSASSNENGYPILKKGNLSWPCNIENSSLTLNLASLDGPTLFFIRIK